MSIKRRNNHRANSWSSEDGERVFLQLGHVLAEIASSLQEKEAEVAENKADKSFTGTSPKE